MTGRADDRTEEILQSYLDDDFYLAAAQESAPSREALTELAGKFGVTFSEEFLAHSSGPLGGIYIEVKEELWPRPKPLDVGPFWTFLYGLYVYGLSPEVPDWMNMELAANTFREETGHSCVPCLKLVGDADLYLFGSAGAIVQWRHDTGELERFEGGFVDLLEREVRELRERKDRKVAGAPELA